MLIELSQCICILTNLVRMIMAMMVMFMVLLIVTMVMLMILMILLVAMIVVMFTARLMNMLLFKSFITMSFLFMTLALCTMPVAAT